jgi:hypothetical protein
MVDLIGTGIILYASKDLVLKMLGPSADYIGQVLAQYTEQAHENLGRVVANAVGKLGDRLEEEGSVPPRVLMEVANQALFAEDPVAVDYLGGVLAASRTGVPRDDRAASLTALIGRLSTYQLRLHYILYSTARDRLRGAGADLGMSRGRYDHGRMYVPFTVLDPPMEFEEGEVPDNVLAHAMNGLNREELVKEWSFGAVEELKPALPGAAIEEPGLAFEVTALGIELYLAAGGHSDLDVNSLQDPNLELSFENVLTIPEGARSIDELRDEQQGVDS